MRIGMVIVATVVGLLAAAPSAHAADPITVPLAANGPEVPIGSGRNWDGFYAGIYGVGQRSDDSDASVGIGLDAGVNAQFDFFLVGGEVALHGLTDQTLDTAYGQVLGRGGVVITDDLLLYASAGYGLDLGSDSEGDLLAGGGVEYQITDDVSLRAQYLRGFEFGGDSETDQISFGANFHF